MAQQIQPRRDSGCQRYEGGRHIITTLARLGPKHKAWFVGGCVRDRLLGREPNDYDLATTSLPSEISSWLPSQGMKVYPTGLDYGTVTVVYGQCSYHLSTLRRDVVCHGRSATVELGGTLQSDALRRDFTINALYEDIHGEIYDYVGGLEDLRQQLMRFVGDPHQRIQEDYLRILRFFRLAQRLCFGLDQNALIAIRGQVTGLAGLAKERIYAELMGMLADLSGDEAAAPSSAAMERRQHIWQEMLAAKVWRCCGWPGSSAHKLSHGAAGVLEDYLWLARMLPRMPAAPALRVGLMSALLRGIMGDDFARHAGGASAWYSEYKSSNLDRRSFELWWQLLGSWRRWLAAPDYPREFFQWLTDLRAAFKPAAGSRLAAAELDRAWSVWIKGMRQALRRFQTSRCGGGMYGGLPVHQAFYGGLIGLSYGLYLEDCCGELRRRQLMSAQQVMTLYGLKPGKVVGEMLAALQLAIWQEKVVDQSEARAFGRRWLAAPDDAT